MKDSIYRVVVDVWRLAAKYGFRKMGDEEWDDFINTGQKLVLNYRRKGELQERLCRDLFNAFQNFYERLSGEGR